MKREALLHVVLLAVCGCGPRTPPCATSEQPLPPRALVLAFDQKQPTMTNAPVLEMTVELPSGSEDLTLSLSCTEERGGPCPRAMVMVRLAFARSTAPPVRVAMGKTTSPRCIEDEVENAPPHSVCTLQTSAAWTEDRALVIAQPPKPGPRHDFRVRVTNDGPPLSAHATVSVIDPLE